MSEGPGDGTRLKPGRHAVLWHLAALFAVVVWGATFISTKVLLRDLTPVQILLYRSVVAYIALLVFAPRQAPARDLRTEAWYVAAALCGITLYFVFENTALTKTYAGNAALIVTTSPVLTALIAPMLVKQEAASRKVLLSSLVAMAGVMLIMANGSLVLALNPVGDALAFLAALMWALFAVLLGKIDDGLNQIQRTRKIFFYGLMTTLLYMVLTKEPVLNSRASSSQVLGNLLFLGLIASAVCYVLWNQAVRRIGVIGTMMYMYLVPGVTVILGALLLEEQITRLMLLGGALVIGGVYLANRSAVPSE